MKRLALVLLSAIAFACGRDPTEDDAKKLLTVDPDLSLSTFFGGDVGLAVSYQCKTVAGPITATARGNVLATLATPEIIAFDSGNRFLINIPASAFDTTDFGNPTVVPITIAAECDGRPVISQPYTVTYVHPLHSGLAPAGVTRVFASDLPNEILACSGTDLVRYSLQPLDASLTPPTEIERFPVGFACTLAEMRGDVGGRRYLTVDNSGIAAVDPGPSVAWFRTDILFSALSAPADTDPVVSYKQNVIVNDVSSVQRYVSTLSKDDGHTVIGPLPLVNLPLGSVTREASGNINVLTSTQDGVETTYWVERFTSAGASVEAPARVVTYGRKDDGTADRPYAEFSFDGTRLFFSDNDGTDLLTKYVASFAVADHSIKRLTTLTDGNGYHYVLGEAYGRLLVASDDAFIWLDPVSGAELSQAFSPDSGNVFYRLRVGPDGSTAMIGDPTGNSGVGFYVFDAQGAPLVRIHNDDTSFSWLTGGPDGGVLLVVADPTGNEVHDLGRASTFVNGN
jgi:hypothetical protein